MAERRNLKRGRRRTPAPAQPAADKLITSLERRGTEREASIAKEIRRCTEENRCGQLSCPKCRYAAAEQVVSAVVSVWKPESIITTMTLIPKDGVIGYEALGNFDLSAFKRRHAVALKRILGAGTVAVGVVELSLNTFQNANPYWQAHLHVIVEGEVSKAAKSLIRARYARYPGAGIHKPVVMEMVHACDLKAVMEYPLKDAGRRSAYIAKPKPERNRKPYRTRTYQPLNSKQACALVLMQAEYEVLAPLFLIGLKRVRKADPSVVTLLRIGKINDQ